MFSKIAEDAYNCSNQIKENKLTDISWNKKSFYDFICVNCVNMIKEYCKNKADNISANFIICTENEEKEKCIMMISDTNSNVNKPTIYAKEEKLSESKYYHAELLKNNFRDPKVAVNTEEVKALFRSVNIDTNLDKYSQYIGIPIYCEYNKPFGIFQIVTEYNYIIEPTKDSLINFTNEYIIPYADMFLPIEKIHKLTYSKPQENMENKQNAEQI